jgi:hypothetical protein
MGRCHYCRNGLPVAVQQKNRLCPNCGSDIHACRNCVHFDESLNSQCKESDSPWVRDRGTTNSCPFFEFRGATDSASPDEAKKVEAERAKEAFRALFRTP